MTGTDLVGQAAMDDAPDLAALTNPHSITSRFHIMAAGCGRPLASSCCRAKIDV
jgi:hypothetical protein